MKQLSFCTNSYRLVYDSVRYETIIVLSTIRHVIKQLAFALRYEALGNKYRLSTKRHFWKQLSSCLRNGTFKQLSFCVLYGTLSHRYLFVNDSTRF